MCPRYMTGFCPYGPECEMSHPKFIGITDSMRITLDSRLRAVMAAKAAEKPAEEVSMVDVDEAVVPEEAVVAAMEEEAKEGLQTEEK